MLYRVGDLQTQFGFGEKYHKPNAHMINAHPQCRRGYIMRPPFVKGHVLLFC